MNAKCLFLVLTTLLLTTVTPTDAQQAKKVHRIGYLSTSNLSASSATLVAFDRLCASSVYVEGTNFVIEYPVAEKTFGCPRAPNSCVSRWT